MIAFIVLIGVTVLVWRRFPQSTRRAALRDPVLWMGFGTITLAGVSYLLPHPTDYLVNAAGLVNAMITIWYVWHRARSTR